MSCFLLLSIFCDLGTDLSCFLVIFEGLGALASDGGVQGRFLVNNGHAKRQKSHPFGGQLSMFVGNLFDAVFEEAPGSKHHRTLLQK